MQRALLLTGERILILTGAVESAGEHDNGNRPSTLQAPAREAEDRALAPFDAAG